MRQANPSEVLVLNRPCATVKVSKWRVVQCHHHQSKICGTKQTATKTQTFPAGTLDIEREDPERGDGGPLALAVVRDHRIVPDIRLVTQILKRKLLDHINI